MMALRLCRLYLAGALALLLHAAAAGDDPMPGEASDGAPGKAPLKAAVRHPGGATGCSGGIASPAPPADTGRARSRSAEEPGPPASAADSEAGSWLNPMQQKVLERVNYHRRLAGVPEVEAEPRLVRAAQSHASYVDSTNRIGHYETDLTNEHYTGHGPFDRIEAARYDYAEAGEVVARQSSTRPRVAIDALVTAIYHRFIIFPVTTGKQAPASHSSRIRVSRS
jgi:uncharacterized protein YkwD